MNPEKTSPTYEPDLLFPEVESSENLEVELEFAKNFAPYHLSNEQVTHLQEAWTDITPERHRIYQEIQQKVKIQLLKNVEM